MASSEVKKVLQAAIAIAGAGGPVARQVEADPIGEVERLVFKLRGLLDAILRPQNPVPAGKKKSI